MADEFWVQGADGQEYGPVPLSTVEEWVREGRVTATTPVRTASLPPIAARLVPPLRALFTSIQSQLAPAPAAPLGPSAPAVGALPAATLEPARIPAEFRPMAFFEEAWRLLQPEDYLLLSLQLLIMGLIQAIPYIGGCIVLIIGGPLWVGFWRSVLGRVDGRKVDVGMLFSGFDRFGDAFLYQLVVFVVTAGCAIVCLLPAMILAPRVGEWVLLVGLALFVVPVIFVTILWIFTYAVLAETRLGFWQAMQRSVRLGEGQRLEILLIMLINIPVALVGLLACCIGLLPAMALFNTALAIAYRSLERQKTIQVFA